MAKKKETTGDIMLDLEVVLDKLVDQGLQMGDILALVHMQLASHRPDCLEVCTKDGSHFVMRYGHPKDLWS